MNKKLKHHTTLLIDFPAGKLSWKRFDQLKAWLDLYVGKKKYSWTIDSFLFYDVLEVTYYFSNRKKMEDFHNKFYQSIFRSKCYLNYNEYCERIEWCKRNIGNRSRTIHAKNARWNTYPCPDKSELISRELISWRFRYIDDYTLWKMTWGDDEVSAH